MTRPLPPMPDQKPLDPPKLTLASVARALADAEEEFVWCWQVVLQFKHPDSLDKEFGTHLIEFQCRLVEAIVRLEIYRRAVRIELKRLRRETRYAKTWLQRRRSALARYEAAIANTLAIGRAIGDGFAWWFYEKDRRLIGEHLKHNRQSELPVGIGGIGERLLVRGVLNIGGRFGIYHGITTFLRIGDISYVDVQTRRVKAIAELKTKKISEGEYRLILHLVAGSSVSLPKPKNFSKRARKAKSPDEPLRDVMQHRLDKQMRRMGKAISEARDKKPASRLGKPSEFYFGELADIVKRSTARRMVFTKAGPGLVIGALRNGKNKSFASDVANGRSEVAHLMRDAPDWAIKIAVAGRSDNAMIIGTPGLGEINLSVTPEGIPPALWPMDDEALEDILFGRVMLVSIYNPAPLRAEMEARGFLADQRADSLSKLTDGQKMRIGVFSHFDRLICQSFMSQEGVIAMLDASIEAASAQHAKGAVEVSIIAQVTTSDMAYEDDL